VSEDWLRDAIRARPRIEGIESWRVPAWRWAGFGFCLGAAAGILATLVLFGVLSP